MHSPPREIELKLHVAPEDVQRLQTHPRVLTLSQGDASSRGMRSVYFDTAEFDLARLDLELRVRSTGQARLQTLKTRGKIRAGCFDRGEYETPVIGPAPDVAQLPAIELRDRLQNAIAGKPLQAVFETDVERTTRRLRHGANDLVLDLDIGEVRSGERSASICELELELKQGDPAYLYQLALELLDEVTLWPATESKAERGYALLIGAEPEPHKARPIELEPDASAEQALRVIVSDCLDQITTNQRPALESRDPEAVHQLRVGVRRLRSALGVFRAALPPAQVAALAESLRGLGRVLGPARDLDVFTLELLRPLAARHPDDPGFRALLARAEQERDAARCATRAALRSNRYTRLVLQFGYWLAREAWREQPVSEASAQLFAPARDFAALALERRHRKVVRAARRLGESSAGQRHRLRIRAKKLRYASEFFRSLYPSRRTSRYVRRVERLQDLLGAMNDTANAVRLLPELLAGVDPAARRQAERAAGFVAGWDAHQDSRRPRKLARHVRAFRAGKPFWRSR